MRLFSKFHAVCALAICSILLSASFLASQHYYRRVVADEPSAKLRPAASFDRRLVVFGDSWSDNNAAEIQGSVWTEWLCSSFSCHHENLAETAKSYSGNYFGSVVDNSQLSGSLLNLYKSPLADLKAQVSNWLAAETEVMQAMSAEAIGTRQNRTIVILSFGVWDLWNVVGKTYKEATQSIDNTLDVIMDQLNLLAELWGHNDLKLILTLAPDVTFLPAFRVQAEQHQAKQKDAISMSDYWNQHLRQRADGWGNGTIYLFDTNAFLADQIRDWQLFVAGIEETNGLGKNEDPGWENVEDACVQSSQQWMVTSETKKCDRPEKFLFWNAFILYRQHWQASVVAQHPGLANPEISKIIGEQWRKLSQDIKDTWKALAEEEKARHQQQYPEYRYQPRRYGRDGNSRNPSSGISHNPPGSTVCSRCGGRVMNPPVSPDAPPFTPRTSGFNSVSPQVETVAVRSSQARSKDMDRAPSVVRIAPTGESQSPRQRHFEESGSRSPDSKRRRFNPQVSFKNNIQRDRSPDSAYPVSPYTPHSTVSDTRGFLQLAPPQRPVRNVKDFTPPDPSLKLPPLQTTTVSSQPGAMTPMTPFARDGSTLEATVMTIPFLNKIKVLAKISPPLAPPYHGNAAPRRGAVIAVDGQDPALVKTMVDHLNNTLQKEGRYQTHTFTGPDINPRKSYSDSDQMGDATVDYLNIISDWHRISDKIINFVKPVRASSEPKSENEEPTGVSPRTIVPKTAEMQINSREPSAEGQSPSVAPTEINTNRVPVALVPRYQLTTADAFACSVQIGDSYAPLDHWQWMASLWRACVGPDITVYIRECEKEELDRYGGNPVEVRLQDARTIVVRRAASSSNEMEEKILKRVSFEIEDFLTQ
ncbi:putative HMG box transcriptional regulator [Aspergillus brunneoviolaceus CBS 621.78]|uniref:Uncharacterized protein n=1 Tax=Aspergillus brunneoviolaceus CBS 621.78 TaxID=1450534 RepID=A0ACD1G1W3_9EURO|nr:hypothetical protein BO95DRAFT_455161 [Aspergillus brunneoviolaceus CBS 621.78]RAH43257.1 hypothetical protein BO95DRAFT_455161 [Aspergillus brunneoviolaceus CBS 621.78]